MKNYPDLDFYKNIDFGQALSFILHNRNFGMRSDEIKVNNEPLTLFIYNHDQLEIPILCSKNLQKECLEGEEFSYNIAQYDIFTSWSIISLED